MPELPEVQTIVASIAPTLAGRRIDAVLHWRPDIVEPAGFDLGAALSGRRFREISRRGKKIVIELDDGNRLVIHLGMTGRLILAPSHEPIEPHTHFLAAVETMQLRFSDPRRFGGVFWLGLDGESDANLGPEPLGLSAARLARQLESRLAKTRRCVKAALLDQSVIAGLGNIYVDESLFKARIHPATPANKLTGEQIARLARAIQAILRKAINHRGSTLRDYRDASGRPGGFQNLHRVYDREGEPCPNCGRPLTRIVLAGRGTCFCKVCQIPPRAVRPRRAGKPIHATRPERAPAATGLRGWRT